MEGTLNGRAYASEGGMNIKQSVDMLKADLEQSLQMQIEICLQDLGNNGIYIYKQY